MGVYNFKEVTRQGELGENISFHTNGAYIPISIYYALGEPERVSIFYDEKTCSVLIKKIDEGRGGFKVVIGKKNGRKQIGIINYRRMAYYLRLGYYRFIEEYEDGMVFSWYKELRGAKQRGIKIGMKAKPFIADPLKGTHKLSELVREEIVTRFRNGEDAEKLANEYDITPSWVYKLDKAHDDAQRGRAIQRGNRKLAVEERYAVTYRVLNGENLSAVAKDFNISKQYVKHVSDELAPKIEGTRMENFFVCDDCENVFKSRKPRIDVVCPSCKSISISYHT